MEFVFFGDLHFEKLDGLIPDVNRKICRSIERVFDYAVENGIRHVIQGGDVGDTPRLGYDAHLSLLKTVSKKKYRDLEIHFNLGNHDFAENGVHTLQLLEVVSGWLGANIHVYTKPTVKKLQGVQFNILPHPFTETRKDCINIGHFEVKGSTSDSGRTFNEGRENKHTSFMGHLHTPHRVRNTHYSGTLYQTNFGESLPKSFLHVTTTGPKDVEVQKVPFTPPWKLLNLTINSLSDLDEIKDEPGTYYKLFLKDGVDVDINRILVTRPNVVRHNTFKSKKDLEVLLHKDWDFDSDIVDLSEDLDELMVVKEFLNDFGLKKSEVRRAMAVLERLAVNKKVQTEKA